MTWIHENNRLNKSYQFTNFTEAFAFMTQVAFIAEKMDHHPLWTNVYNRVSIELSTHDAGDIVTEKDWTLAQEIDRIYENYARLSS